jgi:transposase-like protein
MNLARSDKCKQFRVETEQKGRELTSVKQKLERTNQRLKQATAPSIVPSAPDAEEARLPLGRGQLINMMLKRTNQRLKQATAPGIAPSAPDAEEARLPLRRGQLINMMLERTNQRLKQATAPDARMFNS